MLPCFIFFENVRAGWWRRVVLISFSISFSVKKERYDIFSWGILVEIIINGVIGCYVLLANEPVSQ